MVLLDPPGIVWLYHCFLEIFKNFSREPTFMAALAHSGFSAWLRAGRQMRQPRALSACIQSPLRVCFDFCLLSHLSALLATYMCSLWEIWTHTAKCNTPHMQSFSLHVWSTLSLNLCSRHLFSLLLVKYVLIASFLCQFTNIQLLSPQTLAFPVL